MSCDRKHIHLHIEKTAGTSNDVMLATIYGKNRVLKYSCADQAFTRLSETTNGTSPIVERIKSVVANSKYLPIITEIFYRCIRTTCAEKYQFSNLPDDYSAISGHFTLNQCLPYFNDPIVTTIIREPFARMTSHYQHWKRLKGGTDFRVNPEYCIKNMPFENFAFLPELRNYQAQALGDNLGRLDLCGFVERIEDYPTRLLALLDKNGVTHKQISPSIPHYNRSLSPQRQFDVDFIESFNVFHNLDVELYRSKLAQ